MFVFPISSTSGTSGSTYNYSDPIDLTRKWFDNRRLNFHIDIEPTLGSSGLLSVAPAVSSQSGGTYVNFTTGTGTTLILSSGASEGGVASNGSYFIPLTHVSASGVSEYLQGVPYIKFGFCASFDTVNFKAYLSVG